MQDNIKYPMMMMILIIRVYIQGERREEKDLNYFHFQNECRIFRRFENGLQIGCNSKKAMKMVKFHYNNIYFC